MHVTYDLYVCEYAMYVCVVYVVCLPCMYGRMLRMYVISCMNVMYVCTLCMYVAFVNLAVL